MMRKTDDLHRMVEDLRNMIIGLALLNMMIVFALLTIVGILIFLILKYPSAPPLTTSLSVAAAGTPSVSTLIDSEDPSMFEAQVVVGNLNEVCVSREMLCNENSPILCDSTDAHEMSKDYCIGKIVDEEKQTYTYDKKPIFPTTTPSTTCGSFNGLNKNKIFINNITLNKASNNKIGTTKQTIFNQHTTNFIVCSLDSLKSFDG